MASSPPAVSPSPSVALPPTPSPTPSPSGTPTLAPTPSLTRELERAVARLVAGSLSRTSAGRCRSPRYRTLFAHSAGAAGRQAPSEASACARTLLVASALTEGSSRGAPNGQPQPQPDGTGAAPPAVLQASRPVGSAGAGAERMALADAGGGAVEAAQQHEMTVVAAARAVWAIATTAEQVAMLSLQHIPNEEEEVLAASSAESGLAAAAAAAAAVAGAGPEAETAFQRSSRRGRRGSLLRPCSAPVNPSPPSSRPASPTARRPRSSFVARP